MKQGEDNPLNPLVPPEINKKEEYLMMLKLIDKGLWRNTNLSKALNVDDETIAIWKKTKPVQKAYQAAVLKFIARRKDEEKILNELEVETPKDPTLIQVNNYQQMTDDQLRQLIAAKTRQLGVVVDATGIGEAEETEPLELPETAPETI